MSNIIIGKHTLESLTYGMYSDTYVVFREYIQNSVDSIDEAIRTGIIPVGGDQIIVRLVPTENQIIISDNGLGIPSRDVEKTLISIGNSKKTSESSRGFRGIGRLAALSYCQQLTFTTSFQGESLATRIVIDASKLSDVLADDSKSDVAAVDVLESVYTISNFSERNDAHYFSVQLDGVDENSRLFSCADVENYLAQNAPVPYNPNFIWGKEITKRLRKEGLEISIYNICLEYGTKTIRICKPYRDKFIVDKSKNIADVIQDIKIIKIPGEGKNTAAFGWLAKTNYLGSIYDKALKGIRLRKGNILVGDYQTLNGAFKDARFNGWSIGEIFIVDKCVIPNARRDNFEKNSAFFSLHEKLMTIAAGITKEIRIASVKRNTILSSVMEQHQVIVQQANTAIQEGVSDSKKGLILKKLKETQIALNKAAVKDDTEQYYHDIAFAELDMLIGKVKGATKYKALNTIDNLTIAEKKILEKVIHVIDSLDISDADTVIEAILNTFSSK